MEDFRNLNEVHNRPYWKGLSIEENPPDKGRFSFFSILSNNRPFCKQSDPFDFTLYTRFWLVRKSFVCYFDVQFDYIIQEIHQSESVVKSKSKGLLRLQKSLFIPMSYTALTLPLVQTLSGRAQ